MPRIVIIGSGLAGLLTGLLIARAGDRVTILEKDDGDLSSPQIGPWVRPGVGQASQTHAFLALATEVLRDEAPDILAAIEHRSVVDLTSPLDLQGADEPASTRTVFEGRLALERIFREKAAAEPLLDLRLGVTAMSLLTRGDEAVPHVTGVTAQARDGAECSFDADLVLDAAGRKSQAGRMLRQIGVNALVEEVHKCDFQYMTRWYRLREGEHFPNRGAWVRGRCHFGGFLLCPAGGEQFSISLTMSVHDPLRHVLRRGEAFDRFGDSVPRLAEWLRRAEPTAEPVPFGGIENRRRELLDEAGPIVTGFALVGDSAMHTNPTLGRGTSLAFKQAQYIARNLHTAVSDPIAFAIDYGRWLKDDLGYWFDSQAAADAETCDRFRALARGEPLPTPSAQMRFGLALQSLSVTDPDIARKTSRMAHMLARPSDLLADETVMSRVTDFLAAHPEIDELREGLSRASLQSEITRS